MNRIQTAISKFREFLERNKKLSYVSSFLRKAGIVYAYHFIISMQKVKDLNGEKTDFYDFYKENLVSFRKVYSLLQDQESKRVYKAILKYRSTDDIRFLGG